MFKLDNLGVIMEFLVLIVIFLVDGCYGSKIMELCSIFSEFGLIKYCVIVEVCWL